MNEIEFEIDSKINHELSKKWLNKNVKMRIVKAISALITIFAIYVAYKMANYLLEGSRPDPMIQTMGVVMGLFFGFLVFMVAIIVYKVGAFLIAGQLYSPIINTSQKHITFDEDTLKIYCVYLDKYKYKNVGVYSFKYNEIEYIEYEPETKLVTINGEGTFAYYPRAFEESFLAPNQSKYQKWAENRFFAAFTNEEQFWSTVNSKKIQVINK